MCKAAEIDERLHCLLQQSQAAGCRGRYKAPTKTRTIAIKNTDALRRTDTSVIVSVVYITVILLVGDKVFVPTRDTGSSPVELLKPIAAVIRLQSSLVSPPPVTNTQSPHPYFKVPPACFDMACCLQCFHSASMTQHLDGTRDDDLLNGSSASRPPGGTKK